MRLSRFASLTATSPSSGSEVPPVWFSFLSVLKSITPYELVIVFSFVESFVGAQLPETDRSTL